MITARLIIAGPPLHRVNLKEQLADHCLLHSADCPQVIDYIRVVLALWVQDHQGARLFQDSLKVLFFVQTSFCHRK
jgi:hypothetical protein